MKTNNLTVCHSLKSIMSNMIQTLKKVTSMDLKSRKHVDFI